MELELRNGYSPLSQTVALVTWCPGKTSGNGGSVSTQEIVATRDRGARFRVDYSILDETLVVNFMV